MVSREQTGRLNPFIPLSSYPEPNTSGAEWLEGEEEAGG